MTEAANINVAAIREAAIQAMQTGKLDLACLEQLASQALSLPGIDLVYAATNASYQFQLDTLFLLARPSVKYADIKHVQLTASSLDAITKKYAKTPVSSKPVPQIGDAGIKSQLNAGVFAGSKYLGSIGFGSVEPHEWTQDEREILDLLKLALLFHLSVAKLAASSPRDRRLVEKVNDESILSCYHIDFETGQCRIEKIAGFLKDKVSEWVSYTDLLKSYCNDYLDHAYGQRLWQAMSLDTLKTTLNPEKRRTAIEVPRELDTKVAWLRCSVETLSFDGNGDPRHAILLVKDITAEMQNNAIVTHGIGAEREGYTAVVGVSLDTEKYAIYLDSSDAEENLSSVESYGDYRDITNSMARTCIDQEYYERFRSLFSLPALREAFDKKAHRVVLDLPCQVDGNAYWARLEAVPAQNYSPESRMIVMYYSDITREKEREFNFEQVNRSLEAERRKASERALQLVVDPLTGAFNRAGYEKYVNQLLGKREPIGYLMIDVDKFKELNDSYGHEAGDIALVEVVTRIKQAFRAEDKVFRMGGDEFVMFLDNCNENAWESVRSKLASIHKSFRQQPESFGPVTLSAGLVISKGGFKKELPRLADDALYVTKRNGRAGLTQVNLHGDLLESWNDSIANGADTNTRDELGKWHYVCPVDESESPKLYFDEPARFILGIPDSLTPEQCYDLWEQALPETHRKMISDMQSKTSAVGQAEATHTWEHPEHGELRIRTRVKSHSTDETRDFTGHFVVLHEDDAKLTVDDSQFVIQAMNNPCFHTYYIELQTGAYALMRGFETSTALSARNISANLETFIEENVHPDFQERARVFMNMDTVAERLRRAAFVDLEYLSITEYGWCRSRILPVKWNKDGDVTHVLFASLSIDDSKRKELEHIKRVEDAMRLQLRVGEMISKAPLLQTGIVNKKTGKMKVWLAGLFMEEATELDFAAAKTWGLDHVHPDDKLRFEHEFDLAHITQMVEAKGSFAPSFRTFDENGESRTIMHHYETLESDPAELLMAVEEITDLADGDVERMRHLLDTERRLVTCLQQLVSFTNVHESIDYLLNEIVDFYGGDRALLTKINETGEPIVLKEYCADGISPRFKTGASTLAPIVLPWATERSVTNFRKAFLIPDESAGGQWLQGMGLTNLVLLEFSCIDGSRVRVSVDNVTENTDNVEWIGVLAFFIAKVLDKQNDKAIGSII